MTQFFEKQPDPIDDLLAAAPLPDVDVLRLKVLGETTRLLRGRRQRRRIAWAAGLAAGIALAVFAANWLLRPSSQPGSEVAELPRQHELTPPREVDITPLALEWRAFDSLENQTALYQQAGDRYLRDESDLAAALRCYGNALDSGTEDDLQISTSDSWLLMAIKDARQKEKRDVPNGM